MNTGAFTKTYGGRTVLNMPELTLESGKIYAVIGSNGSGKSTLARVLSAIERPDGKELPLSGVHIGYMPQKSFAFRMSTRANILLGNKDEKKAAELMEKLSLTALKDKNAQRLSGGETAKMALARLLISEYELLILDEPTAAMDMESTSVSEGLIHGYCRSAGCTVILVTHSLQQARRIADNVLFLHKGELAEHGDISILDDPRSPELKAFLDFYGK